MGGKETEQQNAMLLRTLMFVSGFVLGKTGDE
jgi:hypothetical protein